MLGLDWILWLNQSGPSHEKHLGLAHPLTTFLVHYSCTSICTVIVHDFIVNDRWQQQQQQEQQQQQQQQSFVNHNCITPKSQLVARIFGIYFIIFFTWRLLVHGRYSSPPSSSSSNTNTTKTKKETGIKWYCEFYKQTFLCSVTIFNITLSLYTGRPILASAFCVAVGIDQILWYVDLTGYLISGTFPIGVSKYLFWPGTTWASRLTSTHHLWTIPLCLWGIDGIHFLALPLSIVVVIINVLLSRWMVPHTIKHGDTCAYLNMNLAWEFWPDVKVESIHVGQSILPYLIRLIIGWSIFNMMVFGILWSITVYGFGMRPIC